MAQHRATSGHPDGSSDHRHEASVTSNPQHIASTPSTTTLWVAACCCGCRS